MKQNRIDFSLQPFFYPSRTNLTLLLIFCLSFIIQGYNSNLHASVVPNVYINVSPEYQQGQVRIRINGTVTDENNVPMIGVSVFVPSSGSGVTTDANGRYSLEVNPGSNLRFSFLGYETQDIKVTNQSVLNVKLVEKENPMDELVVIGYAQVKKIDLTGAVSQISGEELTKAPVTSVTEALQGRVAGMQVSMSDGQPGNQGDFLIRGPGSLTQSSRPLFVIDGIPMDDFNPQTLNPSDVETISVLKDASSAAIYGSRAANGIVMITTKKGIESRPKISFNTSLGTQVIAKKMKLMDAYDFIKVQSQWFPADEMILSYFNLDNTDGLGLDYYKTAPYVDLQDYIFRSAPIQNYNLGIRGGTKETKYSFSFGHTGQEGIMSYTGFKRTTGRMTFDQRVNSKLNFWFAADYSQTRQQGTIVRTIEPGGYTESLMYRIWGYRPVPLPNESLEDIIYNQGDVHAVTAGEFRVNPLTELKNSHSFQTNKGLGVNSTLTYRFTPKLTLRVSGAWRNTVISGENFYNEYTAKGMFFNRIGGPYGRFDDIESTFWSNENVLNYTTFFETDHSLQVIGIQGISAFDYRTHGFQSGYLADPGLGMWGLDGGTANTPTATRWESRRMWAAAKLMYNYKSRYLVDINLRADGTSKFQKHWGVFPSMGVSWNLDKENFMRTVSHVISTSKLRFSVGTSGNDNISAYAYFPQMTFRKREAYPFNNTPIAGGAYLSSLGNQDLKWERTINMNLGYEFGLWKNRVLLNLDLYKRNVDNLLLTTDLRLSSGFPRGVKNVANMTNEGIELELKTINISNKYFSWRTNFNITFNKNKIIHLAQGLRSLQTTAIFQSGYTYPLYIHEIGHASGTMIGFVSDGLYQISDFDEQEPGVYVLKRGVVTNGATEIQPGYVKYKDMNKDGTIDLNDLTAIGRGQPIHYGGLTNTLGYKNFNLTFFFDWSYGNNIYNANRHMFEGSGLSLLNQFASYADRWDFDNQDSQNPRAVPLANGTKPWGFFSSRYVEDGSFLRLRTLSAEYLLPKAWLKKLSVERLSLTSQIQNLFTLSNYSGIDPNVSTRNPVLSPGFDYSAYPSAKTFTVGLNVQF